MLAYKSCLPHATDPDSITYQKPDKHITLAATEANSNALLLTALDAVPVKADTWPKLTVASPDKGILASTLTTLVVLLYVADRSAPFERTLCGWLFAPSRVIVEMSTPAP